ncbi:MULTISPECIES: hypothetical protein [Mycobacterium]|uniref:Uncharacterized protein n=1 Tax=Mycobacterium kiyosense TaxID=2871094 RepID=A0A9P3Q4J9_9MYCO|nr:MULTISPECIES: hypothetical protein [Mycobacterium]BDB44131.1 hypothetical protein IWGMT90018_45770 [Mycobacterium kiyosense]BDE15663.1 hypothetical protein MKCMC460_45230 [Mycobacterium sp. 20KCMC460]GLB80914.1 hypothetical protein SRL2020028_01700 [Mycobacterium kiyosense]GLB87326.1 hypothetical protein SRL2020130_01430 [Mycobacterium kiyosense]GLB93394.1 hypothetical protein SRL2020226_01700 [Mycobacterium kiyosense]
MSTPDLNQPLPDPHWVMPSPAGEILLAVFGGGAAVFVAYCALLSYRKRSPLPLLFALAGGFSIMLEPIADTLGNVQHVPVNQINAFVTDGQPIPWAIVLGYVWYFGLGPILLWRYAEHRSMTPRRWYVVSVVAFLAVTLIEQIPIALGLWKYYGHQPLVAGVMPIDMAIANMVSVVLPMVVVYAIWPILTGWRQSLVLALVPICVVGGHTAAAAPAYMLINANPNVPSVFVHLAGVVTCIFSVLIVWFAVKLLHGGFPELNADRRARHNDSTERTEYVAVQ